MDQIFFKFLLFLITLIVGGISYYVGKARGKDWMTTVGMLMAFFGAQTGMNIYMRYVFALAEVSAQGTCGERHHYGECGLPAGFFVTGAQQVIGFIMFWTLLGIGRGLRLTDYFPKVLSLSEIKIIVVFSLSFTLNIALNNFSLLYLSLVINLILRSCLPIPTYVAQYVAAKLQSKEASALNFLEMFLMLLGVACACLAVLAEVEGNGKGGTESKNLIFGVIVCVISLIAGSSNLVLAGVLGTGSAKLNSLDTTVYNAIPAALILLPIVFLYKHGSGWEDMDGNAHPATTDWAYLQEAWAKAPSSVYLALASGPMSLGYNTLQYGIVQELSATHVAFAGNFNKAAIIPISLLMGFEHLPEGVVYSLFNWPAGWVMLSASFGSIGAFAAYNVVSKGKGGHGGHGAPPPKKEDTIEESDEDDDDDDDEDDDDDDEESTGCFARR